jgi:hypothetical protein
MSRRYICLVVVALCVGSMSCFAAIPEALRGTWVIDEVGTRQNVKGNPDAELAVEGVLPMMLKRSLSMVFSKDSMVSVMGTRRSGTKLELVSSEGKTHVLKGADGENTPEFTVTMKAGGKITMSAGRDEAMKYLLWKKDAAADTKVAKAREAALSQAPVTTDEYTVKFGKLKILSLSDKAVHGINALPSKEGLSVAFTKTCTQDDFEKLATCSWITSLNVWHGNKNITSLAPLAKMTKLRELTLSHIEASKKAPFDLAPLSGLKKLESLDLSGVKVKSTEPLAGLTELKSIKLSMSAVASIEFLKTTPKVEALNLYGTSHTFSDYKPLLSLSRLKTLNIYMNPQASEEQLKVLLKLSTLEEISMSNNKMVTSLSFLKNAKGLRTINAAWCSKLTDISDLADKVEMRELHLRDSGITDFSALKKMTKLGSLNVSGSAFSDLSVIRDCTMLRMLDISKTKVTDITGLAALKNLSNVSVPETMSQAQIDAVKKALPKLRIHQKKKEKRKK